MKNEIRHVLWLFLTPALAAGASLYNPKPLDDDLILPMPDDSEVVFRAVTVPGRSFWADPERVVQFGDAGGSVFEGLQRTEVNGSFPDPAREGWLMYMGKYELTKGQVVSVLGLERFMQLSGDPADEKLTALSKAEVDEAYRMPVTYIGYWGIQEFLYRYNKWLFDPAHPERLEKMPRLSGVPGFVRLPTEREWEYVARGGEVSLKAGKFEERLPFRRRRLNKYAWTLSNAKHKVRPIGLRRPNPLGVHDLYGNVQEIVGGIFLPEIWQGKPGGVPVRGASVSTPDRQVRSSNRSELDAWAWNPDESRMEERRSFNTGTRLAIGTNVVVNTAIRRSLEDEYADYKKGLRKTMPVGRTLDNAVAQAATQLGSTNPLLQDLADKYPQLAEPLAQVQHYVNNARQQLEIAQREGARSVAQDGVRNGVNLSAYLTRLDKLNDALGSARKLLQISTRYQQQVKAIEQKIGELQAAVNQQFAAYREKAALLGGYDQVYYQAALKTLQSKRTSPREAKVIALLSEHVVDFNTKRRVEEGQWMEDFRTVFADFNDANAK